MTSARNRAVVMVTPSAQVAARLPGPRGRLIFVIDLRFLRENPDVVRASQLNRGEDPQLVDRLIAADEERRAAISAADALRGEQKAFGRTIGQASPEERPWP